MKQFIIKTFLIALPIIILAFPLDFLFSYYLKKTNRYMGEIEVWDDIYNSKASSGIAVYGSSRAWVQFDPQIIGDSLKRTAYNFGLNGHHFWLQYLRFKETLKYNEKPELIILAVDENSLVNRPDLFCPDQFLPYMLYNKDIFDFTSSYIGYQHSDYYLPLIRYAGKRSALNIIFDNAINGQDTNKYRTRGFTSMHAVWNAALDTVKRNYYKVEPDPASVELFERFIKECRQLKIKLVFVFAPEHIIWQQHVLNHADFINLYAAYAKKYNLNFLNYTDDTICQDRGMFYNSFHLNAEGANIFSKQLAHDLKNLHLLK
jgi:hypothetical protein